MTNLDNNIESIIAKYLAGQASEDEIKQVQDWIDEDETHRVAFLSRKNIWEMSSPAFSPSEVDVEEAHCRVLSGLQQEKASRKSWLRYWQEIAAVLLLPFIGLSIYLLINRDTPDAVAYQEVFSPYGTRSVVSLPDGSTAWLNAGSSLKYPVRFEQGKREVTLSGEAYFEVQSDKEHPFEVQTTQARIKATGTSFNVEAYDSDSLTSVTLAEGKVEVLFNQTEKVVLAPDERLSYNSRSLRFQKEQTHSYKWCAWKDGVLVFRDDPLGYVFKCLGQTYNIDFILHDPDIAQHPYRATFEGESLDEILKLLQMTAPIRYEKSLQRKNTDGYYEKQRIEVRKAR